MQIEELYHIYKASSGVQTDTRKLRPGNIFFALRGDHYNGNSFAKAALEQGAQYAVIDDPTFEIQGKTILVNDSLAALQQLAKFHREQLTIPVLAITGSNGKTTTKELIHAVLKTSFRTYTTEGNLNNHIGVPLTLLGIKEDAELAVVEMGANHQGEIASYCNYTIPTHGLITNIGKAHLEGFGGAEGVRKGKGELFDFLRLQQGTAFVNWDDEQLHQLSKGIPVIIRYGVKDADILGEVIQTEPFLHARIRSASTNGDIHTQLVGAYNLPNVLAAVAVGTYFKVPQEKILEAISNYSPNNNRSQLMKLGSNTIIMDAYNANPSSMKVAIENFASMAGENKVLVLGAMAELGEESIKEHKEIIALINRYNWKSVALTGGDFLKVDHPYLSFSSSDEAAQWFRSQHFQDTIFLIKGSRSAKMEQVIKG